MSLSVEEVVEFLRDDSLNAMSEEPIWEFCVHWCSADESTRLESIPSLLTTIRLGLMTEDVRKKVVLPGVNSLFDL